MWGPRTYEMRFDFFSPVHLSHVNSIFRPARGNFKEYRKFSPSHPNRVNALGHTQRLESAELDGCRRKFRYRGKKEKSIKQPGRLETHFLRQDGEFCLGIETQRCKRCFSGAVGLMRLAFRGKHGGPA